MGDTEPLGEVDHDFEPVGDMVPETETSAEREARPDAEGEGEKEALPLLLRLAEAHALCDGELLVSAVTVKATEGVALTDGVREAQGVADCVVVPLLVTARGAVVPVIEGEGERDGEPLREGDAEAVGEPEAHALPPVGDRDGECDAEGEPLRDGEELPLEELENCDAVADREGVSVTDPHAVPLAQADGEEDSEPHGEGVVEALAQGDSVALAVGQVDCEPHDDAEVLPEALLPGVGEGQPVGLREGTPSPSRCRCHCRCARARAWRTRSARQTPNRRRWQRGRATRCWSGTSWARACPSGTASQWATGTRCR